VAALDGSTNLGERGTHPRKGSALMAVLVLLRHGGSAWNAADMFIGWIGIGLSEHGRQQPQPMLSGQELIGGDVDLPWRHQRLPFYRFLALWGINKPELKGPMTLCTVVNRSVERT
jgi:hypothetical protein